MAAPSDKNEIYLSSSPHFADKSSTTGIMLTVCIALLPLCTYGVCLFGIPALITILTSVICCVGFEALFQYVTKQTMRIADLSAVVSGILLALVLPPATPIWMIVLGSFFAVVVAKGFFGGIGANVFNPALTGRAFLFVSFPTALSTWMNPLNGGVAVAAPGQEVDLLSSATALSVMKGNTVTPDADTLLGFFLGNRAGCIGETSILLILLGFVFLLVTKIIDWRAPVAMVATVAIATWFSGQDVLLSLLSGGLIFGAVFMTTDYATSPVTKKGRLLFGVGCGLITFLIRRFGGYPEGVMFSILIMNALVPFLNKLVAKKYGYVKPQKGAKK